MLNYTGLRVEAIMIHKLKKLLCVFTAAVTLAAACSMGAFAASFSDVPSSHPNSEAILSLCSMGVISGYENGSFMPDREITRTEFCAVLSRTMGYNKETFSKGTVPFSDVADDYWGIDFISFCYENGLINGVGKGKFAPAEKVTFEQIVKMLVCAAGKETEAKAAGGDKWYSGYASVASALGITEGASVSYGANAPRCSVAQMIYNAEKSGLLKKMPSSPANSSGSANNADNSNNAGNSGNTNNSNNANNGNIENNTGGETTETPGGEVSEEDKLKNYYAQKNPKNVKTIVVDAGHNPSGKDRGAINDALGIHEEDVTYEIAEKLKKSLEAMGYTVVMTRESKSAVIANDSEKSSLNARVDLAHSTLADLFISIHCNMGGGVGTETYCFATGGASEELAKAVQNEIIKATGLRNRGVKTAGFFVIKNTMMPAILIETGFLDNSGDAAYLTSQNGQQAIATAIANAVKTYVSAN